MSENNKAKRYEKIQNIIMLSDLVLTAVIIVIFFLSGGSTSLRKLITTHISGNHWLVPLFYGTVLILVYYLLYLLPKNYLEYRLEHSYNLSTQTIGGFINDNLKSLVLNLIVVVLFFELTYTLLRLTSTHWWLYASIFWIFFGILMANLTPVLIIPLFYKLKPLENESLKDKLHAIASKARTTILGVFEIEFSAKTKKANAMLAGLGKTKRIILGDTLLNNFEEDEIEVIIAHELGHFYHKHIWKLIGLSSVMTVAGFYIAHVVLVRLLDTFAYLNLHGIADVAAFPLLILSIFMFSLITMPVTNSFSRALERQADRFALNTTSNPDAFIDGMKKLAEQNLADTEPSPVIEFLLHSHPSISKRIAMAKTFEPKS